MKQQLGIYIHIPFCKDKCFYCDFVSFKNMEEKQEKYVDCLIKEIQSKNWDEINKNYNITTIYIGGGTPSYIDCKYILRILDTINSKIIGNIQENTNNALKNENDLKNKNIEITIEVNPGTVDEQKFLKYKTAGINRLSIGLQTTNDKLLKQIGRIHSFEQFIDTYNLAKKVGFKNINVDLMLGLPNQTIEDLKHSLEVIISLNPNHISVYSLILEEGTKLFDLVKNKKVHLPEEDQERKMYWYVKNKLELSGYTHYEISNFAKKGKESKHNLNCWNQEEYIGFGLAAHSYYQNKRFSNTENLENYIKNIEQNIFNKNIEIHEIQNKEEQQKEYMLLGLRKIEGVQISKFKEKFVDNPIYLFRKELEKLTFEELIEIDGDYIKLTSKGIDFANIVWEEFV